MLVHNYLPGGKFLLSEKKFEKQEKMPLEELKRYASQVKKLCDKEKYGDAGQLLNALKEEKITKELLESSKIGHVVNALRKGAQNAGHTEIAAQSKCRFWLYKNVYLYI